MKKVILLISLLILMLSFTSCSTVDDPKDVIRISCYRAYVNTTETWEVHTHNGYRGVDVQEDYDKKADTYTVTMTFKKVEVRE